MTIPVAILAGGLATRMRPLTEKFPKALLEIHGRPFIEYQLALLQQQGFTQIVLCIGYEGQQIEAHLGSGEKFGVRLSYSYDGTELLGTGGALKKALPFLGEVFFVLYGDSYLDIAYAPVVETFLANYQQTPESSLALMTVYKNDNQLDRSNVWFQNGQLLKYDKRKPIPEMEHIDWGLGILTRQALQLFEIPKFDLADLYERLVAQKKMMGYEVSQRFYEVGSFKGLEELRTLLAS